MRVRIDGRGFTLAEVLVTVLVSGVVIGVIIVAYTSGELIQRVSGEKLDLQSNVRRAAEWIIKDARQSVSWELADAGNAPSGSQLKFRQVTGWNTTSEAFQLGGTYVQYSHDSGSGILTRRTINAATNATTGEWYFHNITAAPFYNVNMTALTGSGILANRKFIVDLRGRHPVRNAPDVVYNITSEVKIRNE